jgi:transposase
MSLRTSLESTIPEEAIRVARAAFPKGNVFMQMREALSPLYTNAQFDALFPIRVNPLKTGIVRDTVE